MSHGNAYHVRDILAPLRLSDELAAEGFRSANAAQHRAANKTHRPVCLSLRRDRLRAHAA